MKKSLLFCCCVIVVLAYPSFGACAQPFSRAHPDVASRMKEVKRVGVLFLDMKIYELTAGGIRELREDWSAAGREHFSTALTAELKRRSLEPSVLSPEEQGTEDIEDIHALYKAVREAILTHTYDHTLGRYLFPEKMERFDYSLGSVEPVLTGLGVDALLLVSAMDEISTAGRKALMVVGAFTGTQLRAGITWANMALVDKSGSILWFNPNPGGSYNLREAEDASKLVGRLLKEFPGEEK